MIWQMAVMQLIQDMATLYLLSATRNIDKNPGFKQDNRLMNAEISEFKTDYIYKQLSLDIK